MPLLTWGKLKAIFEDDEMAKRRIKRVTCHCSNWSRDAYPFLVIELADPVSEVKVSSQQLPFARPSGVIDFNGEFPKNPRLEWIFQRCSKLKIDYRERVDFRESLHHAVTEEYLISDGVTVSPPPVQVPTCLIGDPELVTTWREAQP